MQNKIKKIRAPKILTERVAIDKLIPGGQALGTLKNGKKAMLWNAIPGEIVTEIEVTKDKSSYLEGIATKIENPSSHRINPRDTAFLATSPWQILDYNYELAAKRDLVIEVLRQQKVNLGKIEVGATVTDNLDYHYRNKMEYALYFDHDDEQIHLAFHARGSHRKITINESHIERPEILTRAKEIVKNLNDYHEDARKYQSLLLRTNQSGEVSGGLFENGKKHPVFDILTDTILGQTYSYSPNGFFQINLPVYELALQEMQKWILPGKVLDLYSGVGTIGLSIARGHDLTLVECDKSAYRELERNAEGIPAVQPVLAKSEEALNYIAPDQTVILDPPRAGCHEALTNKLLEVGPERIIYLSCNPITQARDVAILQEKYQIELVQPFNFFPRTPHIENLIVLTKNSHF